MIQNDPTDTSLKKVESPIRFPSAVNIDDLCIEPLSRIIMKIRLAFALLIMSGLLLKAQENTPEGVVKGRVQHASDLTSFVQVNISVWSLPDSSLAGGTVTGSDGSFEIRNLSFGNYKLAVSYVRFKAHQIQFSLSPQSPVFETGNILLSEATETLQGVEVVGARPEVIFQSDKKIINVAQMKQTGATNLVEVLENAPGITTDSEGNILLRGSANYKLLIDGKPSPVAGTSLLRQLPVDMVENIEIMTNPSAKYEAEGEAGIINLVLKKQNTTGFMGQTTLMAGLNHKYMGDIQLNYRKDNFNVFAGLSANYIQTSASGFINRTLFSDTSSTERNSLLDQGIAVNSYNLNAGFDWDLNERNSITVSGRAGKMYNNVDISNKITVGITDAPVSQWLLYLNTLSLDGTFYNPQFNYRHKFDDKGHQLDFDVFTGGFIGDLVQLTHEYPSDLDWNESGGYNTRNQTKTLLNINDTRFKTDYVRPFANGNKIEAGAQVTLFSDGSDYLYQDWEPSTSSWVRNENYSNNLSMTRNILAGYGIWSGQASKISYSVGLRGEYTDQNIDQKTMDEQFDKNYLNLFPSGSASMQLPKDQSIQFSFSRRINRPAGMQLNPFPQFIDNQSIQSGNPDLDPELIQAYEFSYQKQTKIGTLSAQTYYRRVKDVSSISVTLDELNRIVLMPMNAQRSHSTGLELTGNITAAQWLRFMGSTNLYYYILQDPSMPEELANQMFSWNARLNTVFLFSANTRFVVSANYTSPTLMLQGRMGGNFMLNLGLTQSFMKRQATLTLGVRDLLRTGRTVLENQTENLKVVTNILPESPMVTLTFTYNLNNFQQRQQEEQLDLNFIR